jgi:hypothetical protein
LSGFPRQLADRPYLEQWARMLRWRRRLGQLMRQRMAEPNDAMDFALALFITLYHVGDWLKATDPKLRSAVNEHVRRNRPLRLARDLANGSKHLTLTCASVDPHFLTAREYAPARLGETPHPGYRLVMLADGENIDMLDLADRCVAVWREFLREHTLPESPSSPPLRRSTALGSQRLA